MESDRARHLAGTQAARAAYTLRGEPFTIAFTRLMLGFQVLLERLWEWET